MTALSLRIRASIASAWLAFALTFFPVSQAHAFVWSPGLGIKFPPPPGGSSSIVSLPGPAGAVVAIGSIVLAVCLSNGQWVCFKPKDAADTEPIVQQTESPTTPSGAGNWFFRDSSTGAAVTCPDLYTAPTSAQMQACARMMQFYYNGAWRSGSDSTFYAWSTQGTAVWTAQIQLGAAAGAGEGQIYGVSYWKRQASCTSGQIYWEGQCVTGVCPAGYTLSGNICYGPQSYTANNSPTLKALDTGSGWQGHSLDPDVVPQPLTTTIQATGTTAEGQPLIQTISPTVGGGLTIKNFEQKYDNSTNQTTTTTTTYNVTAGGSVTNIVTNNTYGSATDAAAGNGGSAAIQFPTDYNREVTQQAIKSKQEQIAVELAGGQVAVPTVPDYKTQLDEKHTELVGKIESVSAEQEGDRKSVV